MRAEERFPVSGLVYMSLEFALPAVLTRIVALTDCAQQTMARRVETHLASLVTLRQFVQSIRTRASVYTLVAALGT